MEGRQFSNLSKSISTLRVSERCSPQPVSPQVLQSCGECEGDSFSVSSSWIYNLPPHRELFGRWMRWSFTRGDLRGTQTVRRESCNIRTQYPTIACFICLRMWGTIFITCFYFAVASPTAPLPVMQCPKSRSTEPFRLPSSTWAGLVRNQQFVNISCIFAGSGPFFQRKKNLNKVKKKNKYPNYHNNISVNSSK